MEWSRWNAVQWSGMEWNGIDGMECRGVECLRKQMIFVFRTIRQFPFFESGSFIFFYFCEARSKMTSKTCRATKCHVLKKCMLLRFFLFFFRAVFKCF